MDCWPWILEMDCLWCNLGIQGLQLSYQQFIDNPYACRRPVFDPWAGKIPGEGNRNSLQFSWVENSMDRGAWQATADGVAKSWTQPRDSHIHIHACMNKSCKLYFKKSFLASVSSSLMSLEHWSSVVITSLELLPKDLHSTSHGQGLGAELLLLIISQSVWSLKSLMVYCQTGILYVFWIITSYVDFSPSRVYWIP